MRICDKCKKELHKGDGNCHMDFGDPFIYDVCSKCHDEFLLFIDDFFESEKEEKKKKSVVKCLCGILYFI